jgi:hypothetical protein
MKAIALLLVVLGHEQVTQKFRETFTANHKAHVSDVKAQKNGRNDEKRSRID